MIGGKRTLYKFNKMSKPKPYTKRSDLEKIISNWNKTRGLYHRKEYSVAIIRAATTVELAANFVIYEELIKQHDLPEEFVKSLLIWANGIKGKFTNIIFKITDLERKKRLDKAWKKLKYLNDQRNEVAHGGRFKQKKTAEKCLLIARKAILSIVKEYEVEFDLPEHTQPTKRSR